MSQTVYVLTNPVMPGLVKIGFTKGDVVSRINQLNTTGVPVAFKLEFDCKVEDAEAVERALHNAFADYRINPNREFFKIPLEKIIPLLVLFDTEKKSIEVIQTPNNEERRQTIGPIRQTQHGQKRPEEVRFKSRVSELVEKREFTDEEIMARMKAEFPDYNWPKMKMSTHRKYLNKGAREKWGFGRPTKPYGRIIIDESGQRIEVMDS